MAGGFLGDLFGSKPKLPSAPAPIDLGKQQQLAIDTNIAAEPSARAFSGLIEDQIDAMIRRNVPGWDNIKNFSATSVSTATVASISVSYLR